MSHSYYLKSIFNPKQLRKAVKGLHQMIKDSGIEFDAIAFRGNSGAGVAYALSFQYGYELACVRKDASNSHGQRVESADGVQRYIIVDDFISSGLTMAEIIDQMTTWCDGAECVGIFCYYSSKEGPWYDDESDQTYPLFCKFC